MTTTVKVSARAWGATVTVSRTGAGNTDDEKVELGPHEDRRFDIGEGETATLTVKHGERPADEEAVPGSAENDALIREVDPAKLDELSGNTTKPMGNMTGATEVMSTTDEAAVEVPTETKKSR